MTNTTSASSGISLIEAILNVLPHQRIVFGTRSELYHIISEGDRDFNTPLALTRALALESIELAPYESLFTSDTNFVPSTGFFRGRELSIICEGGILILPIIDGQVTHSLLGAPLTLVLSDLAIELLNNGRTIESGYSGSAQVFVND